MACTWMAALLMRMSSGNGPDETMKLFLDRISRTMGSEWDPGARGTMIVRLLCQNSGIDHILGRKQERYRVQSGSRRAKPRYSMDRSTNQIIGDHD
ncbi:hypothetical protein SISNIDRAFT_215826 [Sistotremastrum niveocremeum HHB9708]|uniref:Uncharacterized protein n=1 Tax=Sistotremastrum niveocremeum HHB9708 TaxID=1314777 RepID=A0A164QUT8_9AGAM|nr:hypothetical protein SISNIDRAFT_215826 [Sistotremastrum niveocremeum HHB9708]